MTINSRSKYEGKNKIGKKPSKRQMKMQGKTVYDTLSSNFNKSVWKKQVINNKGIKQTIYILHMCEEKRCLGHLIYDEHGYKVCNICGTSLIYDKHIEETQSFRSLYNDYNLSYVKTPVDSIHTRNSLWDDLNIDSVIYNGDKGADKLKDQYKNVRNFEKSLTKRVLL